MRRKEASELAQIILSVRTHRHRRPRSPIEVAEYIKTAVDSGLSKQEVSKRIKLGVSMLDKFLKLLLIAPIHRHLIDWGDTSSGKSAIAFSSASVISSLASSDQDIVVANALKYQLRKSEIAQVVQLRRRSKAHIQKCVDDVLKMRPVVTKKSVFIGTILDQEFIKRLSMLSQSQRDTLLKQVVNSIVPLGVEWSGRLGPARFSLVGGVLFAKQMQELKPNFEAYIANSLSTQILNEHNCRDSRRDSPP